MQSDRTFTVPYKILINGGVKPGKTFTIRGVINPNAHSIVFNLRHRYGIAFHYNPRFNQNVVVCNTWDGQWGNEERPAGMPFIEGHTFEVYIYCTNHRYKVSVNGQQVHSYNHRFMQLEEIDVFEVSGDLRLTSVEA